MNWRSAMPERRVSPPPLLKVIRRLEQIEPVQSARGVRAAVKVTTERELLIIVVQVD